MYALQRRRVVNRLTARFGGAFSLNVPLWGRMVVVTDPALAKQVFAADPEVRAQLPRYSNWPTFPQLFIDGELIGGSDITAELYEQGELQRMLADVGTVS